MERLFYSVEDAHYKKVAKILRSMGLVLAENESGGYDIIGDLAQGNIFPVIEKDRTKIHIVLITSHPDIFVKKLGKPEKIEKIMPTNLDVAIYINTHEFSTLEDVKKALINELGMSEIAVRNAIKAITRLGKKPNSPEEIKKAAKKISRLE